MKLTVIIAIVALLSSLSSDSFATRIMRDRICSHPQMFEERCKLVKARYLVIHDSSLKLKRVTLSEVHPKSGFTEFAQCIADHWEDPYENFAEYNPQPGAQDVSFEVYLGVCDPEP